MNGENGANVNTNRQKINFLLLIFLGVVLCFVYVSYSDPIISWSPSSSNQWILPPYYNYTYKHFFYEPNWIAGKHECIPYEQTPISSFKEIGEGYWEINSKERLITKGIQPLLYGTYYAQKIIWDIQHPPSCDGVKYLYVTEQDSGIGSQFHVYGAALALAIDLHRLLVWSPLHYGKWTQGEFCGTNTTWSCFLYPPSGCFPTEEQIKNAVVWKEENRANYSSTVIILEFYGWNNNIKPFLPEVFLPLLRCSPFQESRYLWWWRAQSVTYIVRPLPKTLNQLEILKKKEFSNKQILNGTIGMYVRHGDKGGEMQLVEFQKYVSAAEKMASFYPQLSKSVYLGTGDPIVVNNSMEINKKGDWKYVWLEEVRLNVGNGELSKFGDHFVLHVFLGLNLHLYTDAHIGTFGSNWCRLIMELLSTVGHCAGCPYYEASCSSVPECEEMITNRLSIEW